MVIDLGVPQKKSSVAVPDITEEDVTNHIRKSEDYLRNSNMRLSLKRGCQNKHELCTLWALSGRCHTNPECKFERSIKEMLRVGTTILSLSCS